MLAAPTRTTNSLALTFQEVHTALAAIDRARLPASRDPLDISLPALSGARTLTRETVNLIGALYWESEVDHTGLVLAAEMLADARYELSQLPASSVAKLDALAQRMRARWVTRSQRDALFARLFGEGAGASTQASAAVNHEFTRLFANLCACVAALCQPQPASYDALAAGRLRAGVASLFDNLGAQNVSAAATAAQAIGEQIRAAIEILQDAGVLAMLGATQAWQALARLFGDNAPDFGRYLSRAQSGRAVLVAIASLPQLPAGSRLSVAELPCQDAYVWLDASGLANLSRAP
ncbi:MAG: hypothetical protein U1F41_01040 [Burkholderiales bacterium]